MKKLIVAAIVACAATFVKATSVDWSYYDESLGVGDGYTFYVVTADAGISSTLYNLLAVDGDIATFQSTIEATAHQTFTGSFANDGYIWGEGTLEPAGGALAIFAVKDLLPDATFYYTADIGTAGYDYEPPSAGTAMLFDGSELSAGTIAAVPEPTSGLLLLLGVAGLALRRRRA